MLDDDEYDDFGDDDDSFGEEDGFGELDLGGGDDLDDAADALLAQAAGAESAGGEEASAGDDDSTFGYEDVDPNAPAADADGAAGLAAILGFDLGGGLAASEGTEAAAPTAGGADSGDRYEDLLGALAEEGGSGGGDDLAWRETYYILFQHSDRPTLTQVEAAIGEAGRRLTMEHLKADDDGLFSSVLVHSPEDNASLEISYETGDAVVEQSGELAKALNGEIDNQHLAHLLRADARLDVMHFERMDDIDPDAAQPDDEMAFEALNPATLISVVEALADLTGGLPIDPTSGEILI